MDKNVFLTQEQLEWHGMESFRTITLMIYELHLNACICFNNTKNCIFKKAENSIEEKSKNLN